MSRPTELTGRWAQLRADGTWSDTLTLQPDGTVSYVDSAAKPDSVVWAVVSSRLAGVAFCIGPARKPHCQAYRLEGDTLVVGQITKETYYRRAR